jgi:histidine triad (HIT) family protein
MAYDTNNVFARILRGEIPCTKVDEDAHTLSFRDINPLAPTHVLVIPKGAYTDMSDFAQRASDAEIAALVRAAARVAKAEGVDVQGYRVLTNCGATSTSSAAGRSAPCSSARNSQIRFSACAAVSSARSARTSLRICARSACAWSSSALCSSS